MAGPVVVKSTGTTLRSARERKRPLQVTPGHGRRVYPDGQIPQCRAGPGDVGSHLRDGLGRVCEEPLDVSEAASGAMLQPLAEASPFLVRGRDQPAARRLDIRHLGPHLRLQPSIPHGKPGGGRDICQDRRVG